MPSTEPQTNGAAPSAETDYFAANPEPASLDHISSLARDFINHHASKNRRVALVTSGGTTVPLENQTVRFIDNFSAGTRGATSAEYFLPAPPILPPALLAPLLAQHKLLFGLHDHKFYGRSGCR